MEPVELSRPIKRFDGSELKVLKPAVNPDDFTLGDLLAVEKNMQSQTTLERLCCMVMRVFALDRSEVEQIHVSDMDKLFTVIDPKDSSASPSAETQR